MCWNVLNVLGQARLIFADVIIFAGSHQSVWDGSGFDKGICFYKFAADGFSELKRTALLKLKIPIVRLSDDVLNERENAYLRILARSILMKSVNSVAFIPVQGMANVSSSC